MKSPRVYNNFSFYAATVIGFITSLFIILTLRQYISFWQALGIFFIITGGISFIGWSLRTSTIYTRIVDNPVEPDEPDGLIVNKTYWLNGEHKAKFLYKYNFTGEFVFQIEGISESVPIFPGRVRIYISAEKEV